MSCIAPLAADVPFALFDNSLEGVAQLFHDHHSSLCCQRPSEIDATLTRLAAAQRQGLFAVLLADYELAYWLEPKAAQGSELPGGKPPPEISAPLSVHLFRRRTLLDRAQTESFIATQLAALPEQERVGGIADIRATVDQAEFHRAIERIRRYIAAGDCYQVNYTFALTCRVYGAPLALYAQLRRMQPVRYGAFVNTPERTILSLSPELFIERQGSRIVAKPMKGTARRGASPHDDEAQRHWLANSEKNRAENLMIVDLIRNDLGRLAEIGSVRVEKLFDIEAYPTVHQMTSTVAASIPHADLAAILRAMFPNGSVSGAPKLRAMQIIRELESQPRGLYTGALGYIDPTGDFLFNVPIRTLVCERNGAGRMGIGSGVVADSAPESEYAECHLKSRFLLDLPVDFELIESLRLEPLHGFPLLDRHLERLSGSARYFGFACPLEQVRDALIAHAKQLKPLVPAKTRLTLNKSGEFRIASTPIAPTPTETPIVRLATIPVDADDIFLAHKTTRRHRFDQALQDHPDCFDILFCNRRGELTEGARSNLFVEIDGAWHTPPLHCGLLPGVMRRQLLHDPRYAIGERVLSPEDLRRADAIYLSNAVRGLTQVTLRF
ncbi:MAG TPA: aminodeoxychorismate synthase component I [Rhodocyclaceae bacterium]|nr:aminodeoxychorismate synthase component I [Rhodocyclaceae bacterium]